MPVGRMELADKTFSDAVRGQCVEQASRLRNRAEYKYAMPL